jgi:hypothetical protein
MGSGLYKDKGIEENLKIYSGTYIRLDQLTQGLIDRTFISNPF